MVRRSYQVWFHLGAEWQEYLSRIHPALHLPGHLLPELYPVSFLEVAVGTQGHLFFLDRRHIRRVDVSQLKFWLEFRRWMGLKGKMGCGWGTPCVVSTCSEHGVTLELWEGRFILWPPKSRRYCPKNRYCYTTPTAQLQWVRQALFITASPPKPHSNKQRKPPDLSHQAR